MRILNTYAKDVRKKARVYMQALTVLTDLNFKIFFKINNKIVDKFKI